jgi:hypothetical protein
VHSAGYIVELVSLFLGRQALEGELHCTIGLPIVRPYLQAAITAPMRSNLARRVATREQRMASHESHIARLSVWCFDDELITQCSRRGYTGGGDCLGPQFCVREVLIASTRWA